MPRKYIAPLIWLISGVVLAVFLIRLGGGVNKMELSQIFLFYGSLALADAGLITHTVLYRKENLSTVNFGFKLMAEGLVLLGLLTYMIKDIFFA